ncbi:MAG: methyltransferase domain-containing protein [Candidatus Omnitrophota bacterium]|nr:methyltransferase domain-containing protein [Candidatus Omnitrophota bacterium]
MNTKEFTLLDKFLSNYRLSVVIKYIEQDDVILDFGCGVQHYLLNRFKDKFKFGYGLDSDIKDCQKGNIVLINYKYQGILPLKDDFLNKIFLLAVLEHIEMKDVEALFLEFSRILKKNGRIIITTPTPRCKAILEFIAFKLKLVAAEEVVDHKHYYIAKEINDLARVNGLRVIYSKLFQFGLNSLYVLEN